MPKRIKISIFLSVVIFLLVRLHPVWARIFPAGINALLQIGGLILGLALLIYGMVAVFKLFFNKNYKKAHSYIPILIVPIIFAETLYNPLKINIDKLYGKVIYESCYEGTQNQAKLRLRKNGNFDIHWTGVFFYDEYFVGKFEERNDTLYFKFNKDAAPRNFGNKAIKLNGKGISFFDKEDRILRPNPYFYKGKCKGLN